MLANIEQLLATSPELLANIASTEHSAEKMLAKTGWRIEVTRQGRYWQWRSGSGTNRRSSYGGKFDELNPDRQEEYWQNRKSYARNGA